MSFSHGRPPYRAELLERRILLVSPGTLDTSFSADGQARFDLYGTSDLLADVVVDPNGRVLLVGNSDWNGDDFAAHTVARLRHDGSPDPAFGSAGRVAILDDLNSLSDAAVLQPDGKLVVAGKSDGRAMLMRVKSDGLLDPTFADDGRMITSAAIPPGEYSTLALTPGGKIVAAGRIVTGGGGSLLLVARFNPDGTYDTTFNSSGLRIVEFGPESDPRGLAVGRNGDVTVLALTTTFSTPIDGDIDLALVRLNADGSYDSSFAGGGKITYDFESGADVPAALAVLPDGKLLAAGKSTPTPVGFEHGALWRFNADGTLDGTFGSGGILTLEDVGPVRDMVVQGSGRIVAITGHNTLPYTLRRFNPDGRPDPGFTPRLFNETSVYTRYVLAESGPDHVVVGWSTYGPNGDFYAARVHAGPTDAASVIQPLLSDNADTLYLRRLGAWVEIYSLPLPFGPPAVEVLLSELAGVTINTRAGNDWVILDLTGGSPVPVAGLTYEGGAGSDELFVSGTPGDDMIVAGDHSLSFGPATLDHRNLEDVTITAGDGDDTFRYGAGNVVANAGADSHAFDGGDGDDTLVYLDENGIGGDYVVRSDSVERTNVRDPDTLLYGSVEVIDLRASAWDNVVGVYSLGGGTAATRLLLDAGGGDDVVEVGGGDMDDVVGEVVVAGGAGADTLRLDDRLNAAAETITVTPSLVDRTHFRQATYSGVEAVAVLAGTGADRLVHEGSDAEVTLDGGAGNDVIVLGAGFPADVGMDLIDDDVAVAGGAGEDRLEVNDRQNPAPHTYSLTATTFDRSDFPFVIYGEVESVLLTAGAGANVVRVFAAADVAFSLQGGAPGAAPGDSLVLTPGGGLGLVHTPGAPGAGTYLFSNRRPVVYAAFEAASVIAEVATRHVFYNGSAFDGGDGAADARDDAAIAPDKAPLVAGSHAGATYENSTSYVRGINGLMLDVVGLPLGAAIGPDDFAFTAGNSALQGSWPAAPQPSQIAVRRGAGVGGSDRVTLIWPDGALVNTWLRVFVRATADTGLGAGEVWFVGNLVGDAGGAGLRVDAADVLAVRSALGDTGVTAATPTDHNRDGRVDTRDLILTRRGVLRQLSVPPPPPVAAAAPARPSVRSLWTELTDTALY